MQFPKLPKTVADRLKALLLILMAIFFTQKLVSGQLFYYIGPRFSWLSVLAVILLIIIAGSYNMVRRKQRESETVGDETISLSGFGPDDRQPAGPLTLLVIALPLILGVIVPANPLNATAIENRGVSTTIADTAQNRGNATTLSVVPAERNVLDWARAISANPAADSLNGQEADVIGFVYRDIRFGEGQFMVARFTMTCCVADATAIGVVVVGEEATEFPVDTWVRVTGIFEEGELDGQPTPVLRATEIIPIEQPEQPYLFQ